MNGTESELCSSESKLLDNLTTVGEQATKNNVELWESHINMAKEWKETVNHLHEIID